MSAFDTNFAYAVVSSSNRTLKITGVNPVKYNAGNVTWGAFPAVPALYAGTTLAYNGYGTAENAFSVVEIGDGAFSGRTEFAEGPLVLPSTIVRIGDNAFNGVKIIGRLTIPASVTHVGANAFNGTLIDELVVENETTSDVLSGVVDLTRVTSKETAARAAADAVLNTLKVPNAEPAFTGITTIQSALISTATIANATINTAANIATLVATSATISALTANGAAKLDGAADVSGAWNFTSIKPRYSAQVLATESFTQSRVQTLDSARLISAASTLSQIVVTFKQNPDFELSAPQSQSSLVQSIADGANARNGAALSLSSAISGQVSALHSTNAVSSAGISTATSVRASDVASVSASLATAVSDLQSADISVSGVLSSGVSVRASQSQSLSSAISTTGSLLQNADTSLSTGLSSATVARSLNISTNSSALSAEVSRMQSLDVVRSSALTNATSAREGAVASIVSLVSGTAAALEAADTAFSAALAQQTAVRVSEVQALSGAANALIGATQSMNAAIAPKVSGSATDGTTSTVFNLLDMRVGDSLTFVKSGGSAAVSVGDEISIAYSASDHVSGTVTAVSGSNVTFTVARKATSASETTIYPTVGVPGPSAASSSGSHVIPLPSAFVVASNYVVTSMTGTMFSSLYTHTGYYRMSLLDASGAVIATSLNDEYYNESNASVVAHRFNAAFIPKNAANWKQKFTFAGTHSTQVIVNYSDNNGAYTTVKGYAVPYSSGAVLISNGALQSARVSIISSLSSSVRATMGSLSGTVSTNQANFASNTAARTASISSINLATSQAMTSVQTVVSTHGSVLASGVAQRGTDTASLSAAVATNVSVLSSTAASISSALSNHVVNRSSQVLSAMTSLVGGAPSSLDTLFEISAALDAGPALYSTISATETALAANTAVGAVASVSASLSAVASALQLADASLSTGLSAAVSARISQVASVSSSASAVISSNLSTQRSVSAGISTTVSARQSGVASISTSLSDMGAALQLSDNSASNSIANATSVRQSGITSASTSLSAAVSVLQSTNAVLSTSISSATAVRQSDVASVSGLLSSAGLAQQSHMTSLSASFSTLSSGIVLDALASVTAVDSAINQIVGENAVAALDTLNEIATAIGNNATLATTMDNLANTKATASLVASLSDAVLLKANQSDVVLLAGVVETKTNETVATQLQTAVSSMSVLLNGSLSSEVQSLQTNMTVNVAIFSQLSDTIRQVDTLYQYAGLVNADGSIKYKANALANMVLQLSSLAFTINASYGITKVTQVAVVQFDATQTSVKYSSRGVEYPLNPIALANRTYTFSIDSSDTTDYANNATAIVITANESALRMAPANSPFTVPKLALSGYTYATPTVVTPYAATTWSDATGQISQVITINFESGVQKLQIDGTVHDVSGTTEKVLTLLYNPGADPAGALTIKALSSTTKVESAPLALTNVYNDYPPHAPPTQVAGSKSVTFSGSTYTYTATYTTTSNKVEILKFNHLNVGSTEVLDVVEGQVQITLTYPVEQSGNPLFRLRANTGNGKRMSGFGDLVNAETVRFSTPVLSSASYTTLSAGSYRVTATYAVDSTVSAVKVMKPSTAGTYIASQAASGGNVTFSLDYTETQVANGAISFIVIALENSYGLQSVASDPFVPIGQYDPPVYVAGSKEVTLNGGTYAYTAQYTSASPNGINVYAADGVTLVGSSTGTSSPFTVTVTYAADKIGQTVFLLSSKETTNKRESARATSIVGEDIPNHVVPVISGGITYGTSGANYTAQMNYTVNYRVETVNVLKPDGTALPSNASFQQSIVSTVGASRVISVTVTFATMGSVAVFAAANAYGKVSAASATQQLLGVHAAPTLSGSIAYANVSAGSFTATMTYAAPDASDVQVRKASSILTYSVISGVATFTVPFTDAELPLSITVVALTNSVGRESAAATQTLLGQYAAPTLSGSITYSGNTASMTYAVAAGVSHVQVRKASDNTSIATSVNTVNTTNQTASISIALTENVSIVVVALGNANARESVASAQQTLIAQFAAPTISNSVTYSGNTASMTYAVAAGVTAVQVRKASDNTSVATSVNTVNTSNQTASISIALTENVNIVVVALGNASGRESAASAQQTLIAQFAAPTISNSVTYSGNTANMTYAVASGVTRVSALKASDTTYSVIPSSVMGQTLSNFPTLGAMKTWTFTINQSIGSANLVKASDQTAILYTIDFRSDRVIFSQFNAGWGPEQTIMSGFHDLPRPTTFTVSFDTNNYIVRYGADQVALYPNHQGITSIDDILDAPAVTTNVSYTGPVINRFNRWEMSIAFRSTGKHNAWRGLIGDIRNGVNGRGWGVWVSAANQIHFSWTSPNWNAAITVAQNTDYVLVITKTPTSLRMDLTDVVAGTTQTDTNESTASYIMSANGPVTLGGWPNDANENFVGTISHVSVVPALASAIASGGSATIAVPTTGLLDVKVVALANTVGRESAASAKQTLLNPTTKAKYVSVGRHLASGNINSMAYSVDDGLSWTSIANDIFTDYGSGVHHSSKLSRWVAVGQGTNSIAHSTNGIIWTPVTNSTAIFSGSGRGVAYSAELSRWVAVGGGTNNNIAHSTDGITWVGLGTNHFTGGGGLGVFYSAELSRWVAVGHGINTSTIAHSTDGVTWNGVANSTSIFSDAGLGVAYGGSMWVAVGQGTNSIAYSTDGITWTGVANSTAIFSERGQGVAYSAQLSRWVAVGRGTNTIAYSANGMVWTPVTNSTSIFQTVGHGVSYNSDQSRWVAVGQGTNSIAHSNDGITWNGVANSTSIFNVLGIGIATLNPFATPTLSGSITYSGNTASMTYAVAAGVTAVQVRKASDNSNIATLVNTVNTSNQTASISIALTENMSIVVVALGNANGRESAASAQQTLLPTLILDANGTTIKYVGSAAAVPTTELLFIQANPRGTGTEWFAVVHPEMKNAISSYASGTDGPFKPPGQSLAVEWKNIVTTLMADMRNLFFGQILFNGPIASWDTSAVTMMNRMFSGAHAFNQPIGSWNTAAVTSMDGMFTNVYDFNQAIGSWNTAAVRSMHSMFYGATAFNQPIGTWNTAAVTTMNRMFVGATAFNQPIGTWNTGAVTDMIVMFFNATAFNQNISGWNVANVSPKPPTEFINPANSALTAQNTPVWFPYYFTYYSGVDAGTSVPTPQLLSDSSNTSGWASISVINAFIQANFASEKTISSITVGPITSWTWQYLNGAALQYSSDDVYWTHITFINQADTGLPTITYTTSISARYVRVINLSPSPWWVGIATFQFTF
jgi:surface protein